PGMIKCRFAGGLMPENTSIESVDFLKEENTIVLKWQELSGSNIITFSLPVSTGKLQQGVYPVRIDYADEIGVKFSNSVGVYVFGKPEPPIRAISNPDENTPYTINLKYPEEVLFEKEYPLEIHIAKGKNTGSASIFVQVPPGSKMRVNDIDDFHYDQNAGSLLIKMKAMPPPPEFKIICAVTSNTKIKAVYPLKASVEFQNKSRIFFHDFILISDKLTPGVLGQEHKSKDRIINVSETDTDKSALIFEELNELLDVWKKSTSPGTQITGSLISQDEPSNAAESPEKIIFYSVQIVASAVAIPKTETELRKTGIVERLLEDFDGQIFRYTVGVFSTIEEAEALKTKLSDVGYPDAFVVMFEDGVRTKSYY
ncbi:MAG: SPOR domain-containing protein, partial [Bacteroidales bacterium]|nr:SPOR domain-containing protein [Bacteroidales bacterium]